MPLPPGKAGMEKAMHEFKMGTLNSGSARGPVVKSRKQAIAIGLSAMRKRGRPRGRRKSPKPKGRMNPYMAAMMGDKDHD